MSQDGLVEIAFDVPGWPPPKDESRTTISTSAIRRGGAVVAREVRRHVHVRSHSVETELVALDVLHHEARLVVAIGSQ
jgi:hypothetical protein